MSLRQAIAPLGRRLLARRLPPARTGGARLARAVSERHGRLAPLDGATRLLRSRMLAAPIPGSTRPLARQAVQPGPAELLKIPRLPGVSDEAAKWLFNVEGPVEFVEQAPDATPAAPQQPPPPPVSEPPKRLRTQAPRAQRQEIGRRRISRSPAPASPPASASSPPAPRPQASPSAPPPAPEATPGGTTARIAEGPAPSPSPRPEPPSAPEAPSVPAIARSERSALRSSPPQPTARPAQASAAPPQPVRVARRPTASPAPPQRPRLQRAPARPAAPEPAAAVRSPAAPPSAPQPRPGLMRRALSALKPGRRAAPSVSASAA